MSMTKVAETGQYLEKALLRLHEIVNKPMQDDRSNIDACIQRFEFCIELFWKFLKRILEQKGVIVLYPKDVLRQSYAGGLISDEDVWLSMLKDRNATFNAYNESLANEIFERIKDYEIIMAYVFKQLKHDFIQK